MTRTALDPKSVFINCPFDGEYTPLFHAILFSIVRSGFQPRCSLEVKNAAQVRIDKIADIIKDCSIGIHDISRTEPDAVNSLPRFNMPLELGLFLGARYYGAASQKKKTCLILDREPYRYQMYISDIAGQDISAHENDEEQAISAVRNFLNDLSGEQPLASGQNMFAEYLVFKADLPLMCDKLEVQVNGLQYSDFLYILSDYISDDE